MKISMSTVKEKSCSTMSHAVRVQATGCGSSRGERGSEERSGTPPTAADGKSRWRGPIAPTYKLLWLPFPFRHLLDIDDTTMVTVGAGNRGPRHQPLDGQEVGGDPRQGMRKGLTTYGDIDFSLFLRKAFIKGAGYSDDALDRPIVGIIDTGVSLAPGDLI